MTNNRLVPGLFVKQPVNWCVCSLCLQEWFPVREHLFSLSSGWQIFVAGVIAVIYLCVKVVLFDNKVNFCFFYHCPSAVN